MTFDEADISIIIPIFNMADTLLQALRSLRGGDINLEIILINDGSTDKISEVVSRFSTEAEKDDKIRFFLQINSERRTISRQKSGRKGGKRPVYFIS